MKIFIDTANIGDIQKWYDTGIVDGVTTNPTHLSKEGTRPKELIQEICSIVTNGTISVEVTEQEPEAVYRQAKKIAALANNIVVKVPCHIDYFSVIKKLCAEDVAINATLVFSLTQALAMAKLGVTYISLFVGRCDDIGIDGIDLLGQICHAIHGHGLESQVLAASLRTMRQLQESIETGADIATVPVNVLEKSLSHPLLSAGMELFSRDWQKLGVKQFP